MLRFFNFGNIARKHLGMINCIHATGWWLVIENFADILDLTYVPCIVCNTDGSFILVVLVSATVVINGETFLLCSWLVSRNYDRLLLARFSSCLASGLRYSARRLM